MLKNKHILLGVTGSIAAYKAAMLIRLLVKQGAEVKVIMTPMAKEFITPLTLATLSKNPILVDFYNPENGDWNSHVDLGLWADAYIIAPASANTLGKMANGIADNLLLTTYLSAKCPVFFAPAMDLDMFLHPANQKNIETLKLFGNICLEPSVGELASGLYGKGRMDEPENLVKALIEFFNEKKRFTGKKVLITAGPTYENIDPVRFIGNLSSGKMGYSIAEKFADENAEVILVSGPTSLNISHPNIKLLKVTSAAQMYEACIAHFANVDIAVMSAAVADYTPVEVHNQKIKKKDGNLVIELKQTKDIAGELGKIKKENQLLIGFALETENELANAQTKLSKKNMDFIVLNSLNEKGAGFQVDTNKITIIGKNNTVSSFELKSKSEVAEDIVNEIFKYLKK